MKQNKSKLASKWITVNGQRVHARVSAIEPVPDKTEAIVMVHGLVVSSRYMIPTAVELAEDYCVYVPDLPGFGKSDKPKNVLSMVELADTLAAWMDAMGLNKATLLGNSMGCQIIANFALRHSEHIERAILVGPTMDPQARTAHQEIGRWLLNIPGEPLSLFPVVTLDYLQIGFRRFVRTFHHALQDRIEEHLPHMQIPTLVVGGARDTVVQRPWIEEATRLLPKGRFVIIDGAAHDVNYNSPTALAREVRVFLAETKDAATAPPSLPRETREPRH